MDLKIIMSLLPRLLSVNYVYIHNLSLLNRFHDDSKNIVIALQIILWYLLKVLLFEKVSKFKKEHATVPFRWLRVLGTIFFLADSISQNSTINQTYHERYEQHHFRIMTTVWQGFFQQTKVIV